MVVTGLAGSLPLLLIGRSLAGIFGGSISAAQAYIADVTAPSERTRYMGMLGASIGLGFVFGPAIGALLSPFGFSTAAFVAAGLAILNFSMGFLLLKEPYKLPGYPARVPLTLSSVLMALRNPGVGRILASTFLVTFAFVSLEATFALFGQRRFGLDARGMGIIFTAAGLLIAVVQGGLVGRLNALLGERGVAVTGGALMALGFALVPFMPSLISTLGVLGLVAVGQGLSVPALSSLLSLESAAHEQGGVLGLGQSFSAAARATGPILAGALFDVSMELPYWVSALSGALAAVMVATASLIYQAAKPSVGR
jgi:DHA1 family tetracycline resistance protein-like MFS transporter